MAEEICVCYRKKKDSFFYENFNRALMIPFY